MFLQSSYYLGLKFDFYFSGRVEGVLNKNLSCGIYHKSIDISEFTKKSITGGDTALRSSHSRKSIENNPSLVNSREYGPYIMLEKGDEFFVLSRTEDNDIWDIDVHDPSWNILRNYRVDSISSHNRISLSKKSIDFFPNTNHFIFTGLGSDLRIFDEKKLVAEIKNIKSIGGVNFLHPQTVMSLPRNRNQVIIGGFGESLEQSIFSIIDIEKQKSIFNFVKTKYLSSKKYISSFRQSWMGFSEIKKGSNTLAFSHHDTMNIFSLDSYEEVDHTVTSAQTDLISDFEIYENENTAALCHDYAEDVSIFDLRKLQESKRVVNLSKFVSNDICSDVVGFEKIFSDSGKPHFMIHQEEQNLGLGLFADSSEEEEEDKIPSLECNRTYIFDLDGDLIGWKIEESGAESKCFHVKTLEVGNLKYEKQDFEERKEFMINFDGSLDFSIKFVCTGVNIKCVKILMV